MNDELEQLRRANPRTRTSLESAVAVDRHELLELLESDASNRRHLQSVDRPARTWTGRVGYLGAAAAAAAVVVGLVISNVDGGVSQTLDSPGNEPARPALSIDGEDLDAPPVSTGDTMQEEVEGQTTTLENANTPAGDPQPTTSSQAIDSGDEDDQTVPPIPGPFDNTTDLLALHFDHAGRDDGHAAAATLEMATFFALPTHVVSGTKADSSDQHEHDYVALMNGVWGENWVDAGSDRQDAIDTTVERWSTTLADGGHIWVAESGVADFTAEVVAEIQERNPEIDTNALVHVIQHNSRNESASFDKTLDFVKANTDYRRIADGNHDNETADLNQPSTEFTEATRSSRHSAAWSAAFEHHPEPELDFSDTVEVLHVVGLDKEVIGNPDEFARYFLIDAAN